MVAQYRYYTGTHGTSTTPVRTVPVRAVPILHRYARYRYGCNGTSSQSDRYRVNRIGHYPRQVTGQSSAVRDKGQPQPVQTNRGNPPLRSAAGATAVLHALAAPLGRRHAPPSPPLDPALARSLLRCPLPLPLPKPFYYPTLHSLGVIGKASEWKHSARGIKGSPPVPGDQ